MQFDNCFMRNIIALFGRWHMLAHGFTYKKVERGKNHALLAVSTGAAYRIRTCDVLIRSQTLYPAEVTPQRKEYNHTLAASSQELFSFFLLRISGSGGRPCNATTSRPSGDDPLERHTRLITLQAKRKGGPSLTLLQQSTGAAYRIRTCDVLIRSQTLYPAEVTPQRKEYNVTQPAQRQAKISTFLNILAQRYSISRSGPILDVF